jgi:protein O-GlcNAc transferase
MDETNTLLEAAQRDFDQGRLIEAAAGCRQALAQEPRCWEAVALLGATLFQQGDAAAARELLTRSVDEGGGECPQLCITLAEVLAAGGEVDQAIRCLRDALLLQPTSASLHKRAAEAELHFRSAADADPLLREAQLNLGMLRRLLGRPSEALDPLRRAIALSPARIDAHLELADALRALGDFAGELAALEHALHVVASDWRLLHRCAIALMKAAPAEAERYLRVALQIHPSAAQLWNSLERCQALQSASPTRADPAHSPSFILPPDGIKVQLATVLPWVPRSRQEIFQCRARMEAELDRLRATNLSIVDPLEQVGLTNFLLAYHGLDDRALQEKMASLMLHACPSLAWTAPHVSRASQPMGRRIRIGFISSYLKRHTIGKLNRGLIRKLDRKQFEVTVLQIGEDDDQSAQIARLADHGVRLSGSLLEMREQVARCQLDVLFYTDIGMEPCTYFLAFARLAPVQIVTWGHPVTSGIPAIDYFLSSRDLDPPGNERSYTENLAPLPRLSVSYPRPRLTGEPLGRDQYGLGESWHLYLCAQKLFKMHPDFDAVLARVLREDPQGRLVLIADPFEQLTAMVRHRLAEHAPGIADRIVFLPPQGVAKFVNLFRLADATLDTPHFGGGNTGYEAFAVGAPLITWPGPLLRGRIAYAQYRQMGVADCIAHDLSHYGDLALRLANDPGWRQDISGRIVAAHGQIFNDAQAVADLERFLLEVVGGLPR